MLLTSTMYEVGQDSIAERTHSRAKAIREGRSHATRLLFDHREAPPVPVEQMTDMAVMTAALSEAYGDFAQFMDLRRIVEDEFLNVEKDIEDACRYFFNQPMTAVEAG